MNFKPIETAPVGVKIRLIFRHEVGEYEMPEPCVRYGQRFYRALTDWPVKTNPEIKAKPIGWMPYAPA